MSRRPGPAPTPTTLKLLRGNPGRRPINDKEPQPEQGIPTRPGWLTTEAKAEWNRITAELESLGVLTIVDRGALAAYCQAWGDLVEARKLVNELGANKLVIGNNGTVYPHPYLKMAADAEKRFVSLAQEFGLTPAARTRVRVEPRKKSGVRSRNRGAETA